MLTIRRYPVGPYQANAWLAFDEPRREALLVDAGAEPERLRLHAALDELVVADVLRPRGEGYLFSHPALADAFRHGLSDAQAAGILIGVLSGRLNGEAENFLRVLAENGRLGLLPEIRSQFEALKDEREGVLEAEVQSAFELSEAQVADLVRRLEKKTGRKIRTKVQVDKSLIAGVRVVLGDQVIDGSARAQLGALEAALKS